MTTDRQVAANRENAKKSTGPRTHEGKRRSRRNALRHGLTAETVIEVLEDPAAYRSLARSINADYRPATNLERELMGRLISLLWRLRRATAIESGLLAMQSQHLKTGLDVFYRLLEPRPNAAASDGNQDNGRESGLELHKIARSFQKLVTIDAAAFSRLGRYETRLWRQLLQTILLLNGCSRVLDLTLDHQRPSLKALKSEMMCWPPIRDPSR